ncbi:MAG: DUF4918 family protein [Bacteroidales bacterium]|nr:DUF4918 family protein [Bacteroidales bacterium]
MTFAAQIIGFYSNLKLDIELPEGTVVMNPFEDPVVADLTSAFYKKYFSDSQSRKIIMGINPGRLGGGVTGIPFTDPVKLEVNCGIKNDLKKVTEPSAGFVYDVIDAFGGPAKFYKSFFIYAVSPLGFTKNGLNYNYYDSRELEKKVTPFIVGSLDTLLKNNISTEVCYCLGNGKNYTFLVRLNREYKFFKSIVPLPHPRWIVQYRRKQYEFFIQEYLHLLK